MILPIAILGLVGAAGFANSRRSKGPSEQTQAERQVVYETAINTVKDPVKLRTLAAAFRKEGLIAEADMLEKRAALRELPDDVKKARKEAFRKGMACTDPAKVNALADAFYAQGCTGAADNLRKYAAGLTAATEETESDEKA